MFAIVLTRDMLIQSLKNDLRLYFGARYGKGGARIGKHGSYVFLSVVFWQFRSEGGEHISPASSHRLIKWGFFPSQWKRSAAWSGINCFAPRAEYALSITE